MRHGAGMEGRSRGKRIPAAALPGGRNASCFRIVNKQIAH